jgi:hypothetical protein
VINFKFEKQEHDCYSKREGSLITFVCPICGPVRDFDKNRTPRMRLLQKSSYRHSGVSLPPMFNLNPPKEASK